MKKLVFVFMLICAGFQSYAQQAAEIDQYNLIWTSQSQNSSESMPCGGGDIGLNVWVEKGELYFYIARSGTFDENNAMLKLGRVRVKLSPNPLDGTAFKQELVLHDGSVIVTGKNGALTTRIKLWVDVFSPVIHVEMQSNQPVKAEASFESWRYKDRPVTGKENNQGSWKFAPQGPVKTSQDSIGFTGKAIAFSHQNKEETIFDTTVKQQGMDAVKAEMFNPLKNLHFGGMMMAEGMEPAGTYTGKYSETDFKAWKLQSKSAGKQQNIIIQLDGSTKPGDAKLAWQKTATWWAKYWKRSYIYINTAKADTASAVWQTGRNYQLFRYMLGCNAFGQYPTKFNGGLFTFDPVFVNKAYAFTPDFRNWGGGLMTAQNQRLVYWPMLKSGDIDMMKPQFDFYLRSLHNAELRSRVYWNHGGAAFTEQLENFGLPNSAEYTWKRPANFDKGVEYNAWLEYTWDTSLEFCQMILETERYQGDDIHPYLPLIQSCLDFFDEHYQYLAKQRSAKALDGAGHLVLYPGSGGETYKMAYNSNSSIAALQTVTRRLLELPDSYLTKEERTRLQAFAKRIPPITYREMNGHQMLSPAQTWERINNVESTQFYSVFPWGIHGLNKPGLDLALNTWKYDTLAIKFRSGIGWKQDNIWAARLGLTNEAADLTTFKLKNSGRRFPAFWGPGFDWAPDHNWGGSGMIGLQEMLMQTDGRQIYLFLAWPRDWDVHFKLHAPYNTTVEGVLKNGKVSDLKVLPAERMKDIVVMLK